MATANPGKDTSKSALLTPSDLSNSATQKIANAVNKLLADAFVLYFKTKNFHWHMSGPHFRDYHLMLDEQADQIFATTDPLAERVRKLGHTTVRSLSECLELTSLKENTAPFVAPLKMLAELVEDNKAVAAAMRAAHEICEDGKDTGTAALLETYIDDTERRTWFLFEASRGADNSGH